VRAVATSSHGDAIASPFSTKLPLRFAKFSQILKLDLGKGKEGRRERESERRKRKENARGKER